jgi:hypothetical protein
VWVARNNANRRETRSHDQGDSTVNAENLEWLEKVSIIVKKWTGGRTISGIKLDSIGQLTVSLDPGEHEDE